MAVASRRAEALTVMALPMALPVALIMLAAGVLPAPGQTAAQGTGQIVVQPLPPPSDGGTLPEPRFMRVPTGDDAAAGDAAEDAGRPAGAADARQPGAGRDWEQSPDGRFHRAPVAEEGLGAEAPAFIVPIDPPPTDLRAGARLRELDKMTGQTKTFDIAVGETREVDRLRIELDACRSPGGNDTHGTMAFLKIWDTRRADAAVFSGWMFAESPALSALDHPRYDLWVISCTTSAADGSASRQ